MAQSSNYCPVEEATAALPIPNERQWAALQTRRFVEYSRDWQAVHDFYARMASGKSSLADLGVEPVSEGEMQELLVGEEQGTSLPDDAATDASPKASSNKNHKSNTRRTTYRLEVSYLGTAFEGFAKDRNLYTVCGTAEAALQPFSSSSKVNIVAAGRTDRGVNAARQVLSFSTYDSPAPEALREAVNAAAPGVLTCLSAKPVPRAFHATFSARWRRYVFLFPLRGGATPRGGVAPCVSHPKVGTMLLPGLDAMDELDVDPARVDRLLRRLEGVPLNYEAFGRDTLKGKDLTCCLYRARARKVELTPSSPPLMMPGRGNAGDDSGSTRSSLLGPPPVLLIELIGNRFLRRMVRVLVATALREALEGPRRCKDRCSPAVADDELPNHDLEHPKGHHKEGVGPLPDEMREEEEDYREEEEGDERLLHIAESRDRLATPTSMPAVGLCFVEAGYPQLPAIS